MTAYQMKYSVPDYEIHKTFHRRFQGATGYAGQPDTLGLTVVILMITLRVTTVNPRVSGCPAQPVAP